MSALDDYVAKEEEVYQWKELETHRFKSLLGGDGYTLNVTSQKWLNESIVSGPDGALWTHQVIVVVPRNLKYTNVSVAYLTGGCNEGSNRVPNPKKDEDLIIVDEIAHNSYSIGIVVKQLPNCHLKFASDPTHRGRTEDALLAQAWLDYINDPEGNPERLARLPMTKAAFQAMRAAQEFTTQMKLAAIEGWFVAGASKRGWTAWDVGAVKCDSCAANVIAIAPLVPIVPDMREEVHRMWQAFGGFTWAFKDYIAMNITTIIDDPKTIEMFSIIDPETYYDRLERIPKFIVVSSDDEFMMMDWTNIYWDDLKGEKHLLIAPNTEHSLISGVYPLLSTMGAMMRSLAAGHGSDMRPTFSQHFDHSSGILTITVPKQHAKLKEVTIAHSETLGSERRDFRWIQAAP